MFRTFSKVEKLAYGSIQTCHCLVTICEYRNNQRELGFQHRLQQCFIYLFIYLFISSLSFRSTHREYSSKPLKHSIVERILVFKR